MAAVQEAEFVRDRCLSVLQESRAELLQAFQEHSWLNMLHLHVGSQGLQLDTVTAGEHLVSMLVPAAR